ncbi:26S proteasome non-ATPase regulatory subunit 1 [Crotalus adamanteus]|uniref:26S proteasome non-ATPase regulatory subunit 1 n=1 Tax=Crotalus adamanteus TaxID=8729 RepID=A0AAW1BH74_CROAD
MLPSPALLSAQLSRVCVHRLNLQACLEHLLMDSLGASSFGAGTQRTPEQCPSVVSLLSESYNPHVRYGAAMALGICCAGTGNKEAINLLEPMTNDPVNYVRQGALIASALIMIQQTEILCPKVSQ